MVSRLRVVTVHAGGPPGETSRSYSWMDPKPNQHEKQKSSSALVVHNMAGALIWRFQRAVGLAPIRIVQLKDGSFLMDTSFYWTVYSIALGVIVVPSSCSGLVTDYLKSLQGLQSTRMETSTDTIVYFLDIITIIVGAGVAIGLNTLRKETILCLLREFGEIDTFLGWSGPKGGERCHLVILAVLAVQLVLDLSVMVDNTSSRWLTTALPYYPFYLSYFIVFTEETAFACDSTALSARFKKLNYRLKSAVKNLDNGLKAQENTIPTIFVSNEVSSIRRLSVAYGRLCDATDTACRRHAIPIFVNISGLFLHLVTTGYFFLSKITSTGQRSSTFYKAVDGLWLLSHWLRLLQIVIPCSRATKEAGKTGAIVGNLLNTATNPATNRQLQYFALQLMHSRANFSACGFFKLDSPLIVSIMAAVTTYLVVLMQMKVSPPDFGGVNGNLTENNFHAHWVNRILFKRSAWKV